MWRNNKQREYIQKLFRNEKSPTVVFFDTETTGLSAATDRVIEFAGLKCVYEYPNFRVIDSTNLYIRPPFLLEKNIEELTGITNEFLADKSLEAEVYEKICQFFNGASIVGGQNVGFDIRFINAMLARYGVMPMQQKTIDTLYMGRELIAPGTIENYKLETMAQLYGLNEGVSFHNALEDVTCTKKLAEIFVTEYLDNELKEEGNKIPATIKSVAFWPGFRGFSRIYVDTDLGSVYYDVRKHGWFPKDLEMEKVQMDKLEQDAWTLAGVSCESDFSKFKGNVTA